jgi:hypothetical protein
MGGLFLSRKPKEKVRDEANDDPEANGSALPGLRIETWLTLRFVAF